MKLLCGTLIVVLAKAKSQACKGAKPDFVIDVVFFSKTNI